MRKDDEMVKIEKSGKVGPVSGPRADEYTEKYQKRVKKLIEDKRRKK